MLEALLNFVQDNYQSVEAISLGAGALLAAAWLASKYRNRRLVSRLNPIQRWRAVRDAENAKPEPSADTRRSHGEMLRIQTLRDSINRGKLRRTVENRQAAIETLEGREAQADLAKAAMPGELANFWSTLKSATDEPVALHNRRIVALLNLALFLGDIVIVSSAIGMADDLPDRTAMVSAVAIAVSIWLGGKVIGDGVAQITYSNDSEPKLGWSKLAIGVLLLGGAAAGLSLLRLIGEPSASPGLTILVWLLLSLAPGLGSTAVTLLSTNRPYKALRAADSRWRAKSHSVRRSVWRSARASARLNKLTARAAILIEQAQLDAEAVGAFYDLDAPVSKRVMSSADFEEKLISQTGNHLRIARPDRDTPRPESSPTEGRQKTEQLIDLVERSEHDWLLASRNGHR